MVGEATDPDSILPLPHGVLAAVGVGAQHLPTHQTHHGLLPIVTTILPVHQLLGTPGAGERERERERGRKLVYVLGEAHKIVRLHENMRERDAVLQPNVML